MTKEQLRQLNSLIGEIKDAERRREEFAAWSLFAEDEDEQVRRVELVREIWQRIAAIEDSLIRRALKLRYVDGLPWCAVAARMGYGSEAGPRVMCDRYLTKTG